MKKLVSLALALVLCAMLAVAPAMASSLNHFTLAVPSSWTYVSTQDFEMSGFGSFPADMYMSGSDVIMVVEVDIVGVVAAASPADAAEIEAYRDNNKAEEFFGAFTSDSAYTNLSAVQMTNGMPYVTVSASGYPCLMVLDNGVLLISFVLGSESLLNEMIPAVGHN